MEPISTGFAIANLGLSLYNTFAGGVSDTEKNKYQKMVYGQIRELRKQKSALQQAFGAKRGLVTSVYGADTRTLYDVTSESFREINERYDVSTGQTDMSFSGSSYGGYRASKAETDTAFFSEKTSLYNKYRLSMLDTDMEEKQRMSEIDMQISNLKLQNEQFKAQ